MSTQAQRRRRAAQPISETERARRAASKATGIAETERMLAHDNAVAAGVLQHWDDRSTKELYDDLPCDEDD